MESVTNINQDWRFERKIRVAGIGIRSLEALIQTNRGFFKRIYEERQINNIYFDDQNFNSFFANIDGDTERKKYRIRWYGNTFGLIINPVLEIKIKQGLVGAKKRFPLKNFLLDKSNRTNPIPDCLKNSELPDEVKISLKQLQPSLLNTYFRRYFISSDKKFRLTLDHKLKFYKLESLGSSIMSKRTQDDLIVEIKYDNLSDKRIDTITNDLFYRISKNSKYANGLEATQY